MSSLIQSFGRLYALLGLWLVLNSARPSARITTCSTLLRSERFPGATYYLGDYIGRVEGAGVGGIHQSMTICNNSLESFHGCDKGVGYCVTSEEGKILFQGKFAGMEEIMDPAKGEGVQLLYTDGTRTARAVIMCGGGWVFKLEYLADSGMLVERYTRQGCLKNNSCAFLDGCAGCTRVPGCGYCYDGASDEDRGSGSCRHLTGATPCKSEVAKTPGTCRCESLGSCWGDRDACWRCHTRPDCVYCVPQGQDSFYNGLCRPADKRLSMKLERLGQEVPFWLQLRLLLWY